MNYTKLSSSRCRKQQRSSGNRQHRLASTFRSSRVMLRTAQNRQSLAFFMLQINVNLLNNSNVIFISLVHQLSYLSGKFFNCANLLQCSDNKFLIKINLPTFHTIFLSSFSHVFSRQKRIKMKTER